MKKKLSFLLVALLGVVGISMATFRAGTTETLYSWESPDGTPVESGGKAAYVNGDGERLNYKNGDYYTMCLNGKKANIGETTPSANAGAIQITLDKPLAAGDKISITGYINKNATGKAASAYILYSNDANQTSENFGDEANIDPVANGAITTKEVIVSEEAAGSTSFKMTRSKADTNLFITKLTITREVEEAAGPEALYIIGTDNNWSRTNIPAMTWNEETQAFEYSVTATDTYYFAICDVASVEEGTDTDWAIFNANNRYAIGEGDLDATIDQATQLQKVNGTVKLPAGSYKVSVTKDLVMTITSTVELNHYNALFENTANWEEVYAYTWSQDDNGNITAQELGAWPGTKIEPQEGNYVVDIQAAAAPQFIIFNNGVTGEGAVQTEDLAFEHGKTYKYEAPAAPATDITISVDDGADIAAALAIVEEGEENIGNISINLAEGGNYTVSAPLVAHKNFEIQGNGATIDASELGGNFIMMAATAEVPAEAVHIEYVSIHNATIKGLKQPLFYSTQKGYLINWLTIDNCVIEQAADATTIDFTKGSAARSFNIENSTIYAPVATTKSFYSSQAGQKLTELDAEGTQTFIVKNSTMCNLAKGKNFFTHRQNNQKWLAYYVENSLFVNCGKSGQVIKGMNGGSAGANPTWTVTGNAFNFEAEGVMTDTSAAEDTGDTTEGEGVQNSVAGIVTFTDAAVGDFGGVFDIGDGKAPEALGDPRWKLSFKTIPVPSGTYYVMNANAGAVVNAESAIDAKGAPITFAYDAATESYTISGAAFFAEKQWTVANQYEDMPGYFVITTVVDEATKYLTVDADGKLALADAADDKATWIVLEKAYWEDIANSTYTVAGTKNLTGTDEDWQIAEANQMKYNEETKLFEITYKNVTVNNSVKPEFKVLKTNMNKEQSWYPEGDNSNWIITPEVLAGEGEYVITITFDPSDSKEIKVTGLKIEDITISPESGADIFEALIAAEMGKQPRNISINLAEGGNYTITGPLTAYANFEIQGHGATIDASGLSNNFIQMATAEVPKEAVQIENVSIHNATVKGLKKPLFYSTQKGYLINWLTIDNSVIELAADATTIDFTKGSAARSFNIENSTIYAPVATTKQFYSSQGGQKLTELDAEGIQTFIVKNSTMYNLATGKNFFSHRQSNQKWLAYYVENSLFVNCGKSGQVIKGMNGGSAGANPTWTVTGNAFNFEAEGVMTDTSAAEDTGDTTEGEGVQNSVAGIVTFTDAAAGDFSGVMTVTDGSVKLQRIGDPRWFVMYNYPDEPLANPEKLYIIGDITPNGWAKTGLAEMNFDETTQTFTYEFETTLSRACFAIADVAEFTDWADFNFYHRYAYEQQGGDQKAKFNEATQLTKTKGEGTIELSDGKYTISISKADGKMTITGEATPYTVAGAFSVDGVEEESFFGTKWDPTLTANDMTILPDYTYQKVYTDVKFEKAGTILYKVCKNHAWTECFGDGEGNNATCTVSEPCTATVTFTFNPYADGQKVSCELSDVVGISSVKTVDQNDAPVFNLNGQRVNKAQKGLFIVGGKKVVRK